MRRRGHEVALRTLASEVQRMRSMGIEAEAIAPQVEAIMHTDWRAHSPLGANRRTMRSFAARAGHDGPDMRRAIDEKRPDAVLVDVMAWGALAVAEAWDGPRALFCPMPLPLSSRDAPAFGPGFRPARGAVGHLRDRLAQNLFELAFDRFFRRLLDPIRKEAGLPPLVSSEEILRRPPLLLYMTSEAFEYPRSDWPENVVMTGPGTWDPPSRLPAELAEREAPFVLVTTSSDFQNDSRLVHTAFAALAGEPYHVVATMPAAEAAKLQVPTNATVLPFAPHSPILARSVCAITHGGMGITQKSLAQGVPVCAVPFGRDQFEVARRVEVAEAGSRLPGWPAWQLRPRRLRSKVREAISRRAGAERIAKAFADLDGPHVAADAIECRLLGREPSSA